MAQEESVSAMEATTNNIVPVATAQQAHSISTTDGSVILAGGSVSIQANHYHGQTQQAINIEEILRLVPNLRKVHLDVLSKATPGTAVWILKTKYFKLWLEPNGILKILWGSGIPGAGKSVMASVVINDLEARAEASGGMVCVAYVYFRYSDAVDLTVRGILEILVKQTIERHPYCASIAEEVYTRHQKEKTQPTQAELLQLLHRFTTVKTVTFYVLEALDEAPEKLQVEIIRTLASLNAKLLITSRPLESVKAKFSDAHCFNIIAQDDDLDLHIARKISSSRDLEDLLDEDPSFKQTVVSSIKKTCGGMFLHASLQLDAICDCGTAQDILDTLAEFPSNIEDVYHRTWSRILSQTARNVLMAKAALVWVLNAARPMTIEELRHAIATHPDSYKFERKRLASNATLLTRCCGLLVVEDETKLVRLIHYTAKDTLTELLRESFPRPHFLLAAVCITHLTKSGFQDTTIETEEEFNKLLKHDPLLAYSSHAWSIHAGVTLDLPESRHRSAMFVSKCTAFPCFTNPGRTSLFDILTPLHVLAVHGLPLDLAAAGEDMDPNIQTRKKKMTPLLLAASCGNVGMLEALLALKEIKVNLTNTDGWSALMYTAQEGHVNAAKRLLTHAEVQVNLVDKVGLSALMISAHHGHEGVAQVLLAHQDTQVNMVDLDGWSALMEAARKGHEGVIKLLLAHPKIQLDLASPGGATALMLARARGHESIACLLSQPHIGMGVSTSMAQGIIEVLLSSEELMVEPLGEGLLAFQEEHWHSGVYKSRRYERSFSAYSSDDDDIIIVM